MVLWDCVLVVCGCILYLGFYVAACLFVGMSVLVCVRVFVNVFVSVNACMCVSVEGGCVWTLWWKGSV